jgi:hypothetical protein
MRFSSSLARALMKGGGLVLVWLLVPSVASAAAASGRGGSRVCKAQALVTLNRLARVARSVSGPVAHRFMRAALDLTEGGERFERRARPFIGDDDEAIQNDAPAAWVVADVSLASGLEPIGFLARFGVRQPKVWDFSPRSPRGPPAAV